MQSALPACCVRRRQRSVHWAPSPWWRRSSQCACAMRRARARARVVTLWWIALVSDRGRYSAVSVPVHGVKVEVALLAPSSLCWPAGSWWRARTGGIRMACLQRRSVYRDVRKVSHEFRFSNSLFSNSKAVRRQSDTGVCKKSNHALSEMVRRSTADGRGNYAVFSKFEFRL